MVTTSLRVAGWTVFGLVAWVACCWLVNSYGQQWGMVLAGLSGGAAWTMTDRAQRFLGWLREAIETHGKVESAARDMGIAKSQLSEGLSGTEQLSFSRATALPDPVWEQFCVDVLEASGRYVVIPRGILADLVLSNERMHQSLRESMEPARPQLAFSSERKCAS